MQKTPGILLLEGNKTYGRTLNKKRMYYKCIPNDSKQSPVLIPYELLIGFVKKFTNRYVLYTVQYEKDMENINQKYAILQDNIGEVNDLDAFIQYRIHCRNLFFSTNVFNKMIREFNFLEILNRIITRSDYQVVMCDEPVITIDPASCQDFDDGFSVVNPNRIRIHIANPALWIDTMQLWDMIPNRTTTLYLPNKKEPMLPPILSENWCSLKQTKEPRIAFTLEAEFNELGEVVHERSRLFNSSIHIHENYVYETPECFNDMTYIHLKTLAEKRANKSLDSHEVVEHWMIFMNEYCGKILANKKTGIFRTAQYISDERVIPENIHITKDMQKVIKEWGRISGKYSLWEPSLAHIGLQISDYVHITSPIRRLVDMVNQMILMNVNWNQHAQSFIDKHLTSVTLAEINRQNKESRKLQQECENVWWIAHSPDALYQIYTGMIFDILSNNNDNINGNQNEKTIVVYIETLKKMIYIKMKQFDDSLLKLYSEHVFRPYYFENEGNMYRKIRWQLVEKSREN